MDYEVAIIGGGPAGLSAAIYSGRAGVKNVLFDQGSGGGLLQVAPLIENYPGFESVKGYELAERIITHAKRYTDMHLYEEVKDISFDDKAEIFSVSTDKGVYNVKAVILCTGTKHKKINVPGEDEFIGKGVSYCATCDGFFFKGKNVAVVGGGNSALIEAIFLKQIGCRDVYVVHRRNQFKAEKVYINEAEQRNVKFILDTVVEEINGSDHVTHINIKNVLTGSSSELKVDGVFISAGVVPYNDLGKKLGLRLDDNGYIIVDSEQRTSMKGVYAAGDICGGVRQVITSCSRGVVSALTALETLKK